MRASQMADGEDDTFSVDLTNEPEKPEGSSSAADGPPRYSNPDEALDELLAPYGYDPVDKARELLASHRVALAKKDGERFIFQVRGSRLYITQVIADAVSCDCPNGQARGDDATCYHSIAARVVAMGLEKTWLGADYVVPVLDGAIDEPAAEPEPAVEPAAATLQATMLRRLSGRFAKERLELWSDGSVGIRVWLEYREGDKLVASGWSAPVVVNPTAYDWELPESKEHTDA